MYLLPAGMPARSKTKWGGLGILPAMMDRSTIDRYSGGATNLIRYVPNGSGIIARPPTTTTTVPLRLPTTTTTVPRPPIVPVVEKPSPIVYMPPPVVKPPVSILPAPRPPIVPTYPAPRSIPLPIIPKPPVAVTPPANTGTPVPGGFPTNQFFVATDGSVWEFGSGKWFNTGTPYRAPGASTSATPAPVASAPAASGGSSSPSAPVNVSVTSDSGYQTILDWLPQRTLLSFAPNWAVVGGVGLIAWKMFGKGGR